MTNPIASQINSRNQLPTPDPYIIIPQTIIPIIGTNGINGVLNPLGKSGLVFLKTRTPKQTKINANKVPILVISPTISIGTKAAKKPTNNRIIKLAL